MAVDDLDISRVSIVPVETDPVLFVDSNAVLTFPITA
jgi:hypothetical protein